MDYYSSIIKMFAFVNEVVSATTMTIFVADFFKARKCNSEEEMSDFIAYLNAAADGELPTDLKRIVVFEAKDRLGDMAKNN